MDFYITKYQGKPMEALTPLLMTMMSGIRRLEKQEDHEEAEAEAARQAGQLEQHVAGQPVRKQRKA